MHACVHEIGSLKFEHDESRNILDEMIRGLYNTEEMNIQVCFG